MIGASRAPALDVGAGSTLRDISMRAVTATAFDPPLPIWDVAPDGHEYISRLPNVFTVAVVVPSITLGPGAHVAIEVCVDDDIEMKNAPAVIGAAVITGPGAYKIVAEVPAVDLARAQTNGLYAATRCEITGTASVIYSAHIIPGG